MPLIAYIRRRFGADTQTIIDHANVIVREYAEQGFDLTLRQLYYQFVARDLLKNTQKNYKRLGSIVNDARLAGLIDWESIVDRTRNLSERAHWGSPGEIVASAAKQFRVDKWKTQKIRVEVWIEKEALAGVFERVCHELDIPYFSCRGYVSQSEMWAAAERLKRHEREGQQPYILHFGDHDPSGLDMTQDITKRLSMFGSEVEIERLALNMDQVEEYSPPPNPAKTTDARFKAYQEEHGDESWELDALSPEVLAGLVRDWVEGHRDDDLWEEAEAEETEGRAALEKLSKSSKLK